jgi:hypothetical protein
MMMIIIVGDSIISNLETQRENLVDADEKVRDTKKITIDAKYVLRMMGNRALMHKACVMLTILILGKYCKVM